ncbi:uncharacterized protein LOC105664232 [Megachile rotundata]|uniref:uncharacterized protein LOC105664232 n=1 Tax=Megachile rotundata TaxID=143995 RepID=UPI000614E556|nr:PREDICTED: uncharacterized protein LOC105664232 [Megachile rotundata]
MNHIAQVLSTKLKSPTRNTETSRIFECGSWRSRVLVKMKECRDAIKNIVSFDKSPNTVETARTNVAAVTNKTSLSSIDSGLKTSVSSLSDITRFSSIAFKDKELEGEEIRRRNSTSSSSLEKELNASTNSSLKSFLDEEQAYTIKKKISAEPFLSYTEGTVEFLWTDDTETSLSSQDINFGNPPMNSTFCENSLANINRASPFVQKL